MSLRLHGHDAKRVGFMPTVSYHYAFGWAGDLGGHAIV
jgi:hypothetical protein